MSNNKYANLTTAAKTAIDAPFSDDWQDTVTLALAAMERYETGAKLDNKSHDLLENAILDKLSITDDMPADELEAYLRALGVPIETGGEVRHDGTTGPRGPNTGETPKTKDKYRPYPKAARIIAKLVRDHGINPAEDLDIKIIPQKRRGHHEEPYWIIGVKPWHTQMAICNLTDEGSYVGKGMRSREEWQEHLSNKTRLRTQKYQQDNNLLPINNGGATNQKYTARVIDVCKNGVENARINADTILECMYHYIAAKDEIPGQKSENLLRPLETFNSYKTMVNNGRIEGYSKGSKLLDLLLDDLARRTQKWRKEKGYLPDETTDEVIDPKHTSLSQITWQQIGTLIKQNKPYGFNLSEEWQNRGLISPKTPQTACDLTRINAALRELSENETLPGRRTKTNFPNGKTWAIEDQDLRRNKFSLARFFRATGLKSTEAAWQTPITAEDIENTRESFERLDEAAQAKVLAEYKVGSIDELCDAIDENGPSISLLLEGHPVEQAQRAELDAD